MRLRGWHTSAGHLIKEHLHNIHDVLHADLLADGHRTDVPLTDADHLTTDHHPTIADIHQIIIVHVAGDLHLQGDQDNQVVVTLHVIYKGNVTAKKEPRIKIVDPGVASVNGHTVENDTLKRVPNTRIEIGDQDHEVKNDTEIDMGVKNIEMVIIDLQDYLVTFHIIEIFTIAVIVSMIYITVIILIMTYFYQKHLISLCFAINITSFYVC